VRSDSYLVDLTGVPMMRFMLGHVGSGSSPIRRLTMIGKFLAGGSNEVRASMASHCEASGDLSLRLGLGPEVRDPLQQAFNVSRLLACGNHAVRHRRFTHNVEHAHTRIERCVRILENHLNTELLFAPLGRIQPVDFLAFPATCTGRQAVQADGYAAQG